MLEHLKDKDVQKKLLRKIMYFTYLQGLGNDERSFAIKGFMKMIANKM